MPDGEAFDRWDHSAAFRENYDCGFLSVILRGQEVCRRDPPELQIVCRPS